MIALGRLFDCLIAVDQLQLAKLLVEFLQRFRLPMENREAIADCLRRIILSDGQGAAAAIADAFRLGRIGDECDSWRRSSSRHGGRSSAFQSPHRRSQWR